jgi:hypothetical protein
VADTVGNRMIAADRNRVIRDTLPNAELIGIGARLYECRHARISVPSPKPSRPANWCES